MRSGVEIQMELLQILDVDEKGGQWTIRIMLLVYYLVDFTWNPENYGNITFMTLPKGSVWSPDLGTGFPIQILW